MTTLVFKQLATKQDLALGRGKVTQERNNQEIELDEIDFVEGSELESTEGATLVGTEGGSTVAEELRELFYGQGGGSIVFQTYAELDAYVPQNETEQRSSYKVANDPDPLLNGYYSWDFGTTYIKDASLVYNTVTEANNSVGVSGLAVFSYSYDKTATDTKDADTLVAAKDYVDNTTYDKAAADGRFVEASGDSMYGILDMGANRVTRVADAASDDNAINLGQLMQLIQTPADDDDWGFVAAPITEFLDYGSVI